METSLGFDTDFIITISFNLPLLLNCLKVWKKQIADQQTIFVMKF